MAVHTIQMNICQYKTQESQTGITHIAFSEECKAGTEMSTGLGGGCDWLKNSSTCNIKFNQHLSIPKKKKKKQESQAGMTHIAASEELAWEIELSTGLGGGCNWLKNGSTYNTNKHMPI